MKTKERNNDQRKEERGRVIILYLSIWIDSKLVCMDSL